MTGLRSMTGFGRARANDAGREMTVELRAVNHRYLDLAFRLPRTMQYLEPSLRALAQQALARGHVDITLFEQRLRPAAREVGADTQLAGAYMAAAARLAKAHGLKGRLKLKDLMLLPDVLQLSEPQDDEQALEALAAQAMAGALAALNASREREGAAMKADLLHHLDELSGIHQAMLALAPEQLAGLPQRLNSRLAALDAEGIEPQRLAQEIALMADRAAVDEELARLHAHVVQMRAILEEPGPHGRRLDFLAQEMGREVNTIASKASLLALTQQALAGKNCVEKLREQVQNLE